MKIIKKIYIIMLMLSLTLIVKSTIVYAGDAGKDYQIRLYTDVIPDNGLVTVTDGIVSSVGWGGEVMFHAEVTKNGTIITGDEAKINWKTYDSEGNEFKTKLSKTDSLVRYYVPYGANGMLYFSGTLEADSSVQVEHDVMITSKYILGTQICPIKFYYGDKKLDKLTESTAQEIKWNNETMEESIVLPEVAAEGGIVIPDVPGRLVWMDKQGTIYEEGQKIVCSHKTDTTEKCKFLNMNLYAEFLPNVETYKIVFPETEGMMYTIESDEARTVKKGGSYHFKVNVLLG